MVTVSTQEAAVGSSQSLPTTRASATLSSTLPRAFITTVVVLGDDNLAEELTQETFLKAWLSLPMRDQKRTMNFRPWVYRIAYTTMVDYLRRNPQSAVLTGNNNEKKLEHASWAERTESSLCKRESIQAALKKVYPQYRQCLVLRYIYDYSFQEIARTLGISEVAVRANISRGRKQFIKAYLYEIRNDATKDDTTREEGER